MTAAALFLLPSGEKVGRAAARMRGRVPPVSSLTSSGAPVADRPLIRHAPHDTFSPEGRRIGERA